MPAKSRKQQKYLIQKFGIDWVRAHHFDVVDRSKKKKTKSR